MFLLQKKNFQIAKNCGKINKVRSLSTLTIVNPANGNIVSTLNTDDANSIKEKISKAKDAQISWSNLPYEERKKKLVKFGTLLASNIEESAKILTTEMGKPINQAKGEIKGVQARLKFFLDNTENFLKPSERRSSEGLSEIVKYEPLGIIGNISAWNYPYFVGCNVFIPALLTGNAVIYKPSEYATLTGLNIAKFLHEAGVPKDIFVTVVGKGDVGSNLLDNDINGVFFTGSYSTGKKIASIVAGRMIKMQLELGGKDPTYVCEDADPVESAKSLADGAMYNTGQSCCSVERLYVHSSIYDQFVKEFVEQVKKFSIGDPMSEKTYIGALTLPKQVAFLENQVKDAVSKGGKVLTGGSRITGNGNYFQPTVIVNVNHSMDIMKEESFGPIIGIQKVKNDEEAINLMNDTFYGLTSGVYTKSKDRAEKLLSKVNSGTVYWNACDRVSPYLPWSGRKGSGIGATLGNEGIQAFVIPKAYHLITK
jgi:acyl-CoA reductase-like NAD-dependent aldehyde dehydrogenase